MRFNDVQWLGTFFYCLFPISLYERLNLLTEINLSRSLPVLLSKTQREEEKEKKLFTVQLDENVSKQPVACKDALVVF